MNDKLPASRIIIGTSQMACYLGVSRPKIHDYLAAGMPGFFLSGKWHFHIDNVDAWFRSLTAKMQKTSGEILEETAD